MGKWDPGIEKDAITVVCAWCGREMQHGGKVVSHGICPACTQKLLRTVPVDWRRRN